MLTLESFEEAAEIVKQVTQETKLIKSAYFSELTGNKVFLKPENMQRTGAYKVRGAYYKISTLSEEERAQKSSSKGMFTTKPVLTRWNWQKKKDTLSSIHSMIRLLQQDREPSPWRSFRSCRW